MLLVNPLHAVHPGLPQEPSPYFPSSRLYPQPALPAHRGHAGRQATIRVVQEAAARGRARCATRRIIDRDRILPLKMRALESLWSRLRRRPGFRRLRRPRGRAARALRLLLRPRRAPPGLVDVMAGSEYRRPDSPAVRALRRPARASGSTSTAGCSGRLDTQLARAGRELPVVHDLAVGFASDGADAWLWQDVVASAARIGAPPDDFNPAGQDWGVPPFDPHRLRAAGYAPLVATMRRMMRAGRGIRIDHVMGMFRLWWVPLSARDPSGGAYVRYPANELLDILALESVRAGCGVIGEDLGTVEDGRPPGAAPPPACSPYRLAWFEAEAPKRYPTQRACGAEHPRPADRRGRLDRCRSARDGGRAVAGSTARPSSACAASCRRSPVSPTATPRAVVVERAYAALGVGAEPARGRDARRRHPRGAAAESSRASSTVRTGRSRCRERWSSSDAIRSRAGSPRRSPSRD